MTLPFLPNFDRVKSAFYLARKLGWASVSFFARALRDRLWGTKVSFTLRCSLDTMPATFNAKIPVDMQPVDAREFPGFRQELAASNGSEDVDLLVRQEYCNAGVETLYATLGEDGSPAYVQWLVGYSDQAALHAFEPGLNTQLQPGEAMVEGAYTFAKHRGKGVMIEGMAQLLRRAKASGTKAVFTRVSVENIASLRGCAKVGFVPDSLLVVSLRLGVKRVASRPMNDWGRELWKSATTAKPAPTAGARVIPPNTSAHAATPATPRTRPTAAVARL